MGAPLTSNSRRYRPILLINVTSLRTKEQLINIVRQAYKTDEDQELFIQFYKNGFGLRLELDNINALEGEEATAISVDKPDGSCYENPKWLALFGDTKGFKSINVIRSIRYAYGWTYLFNQLDKFRQTGIREDYPNPVTVYQMVENRLNDPIA